jgi:hypothetical protein
MYITFDTDIHILLPFHVSATWLGDFENGLLSLIMLDTKVLYSDPGSVTGIRRVLGPVEDHFKSISNPRQANLIGDHLTIHFLTPTDCRPVTATFSMNE